MGLIVTGLMLGAIGLAIALGAGIETNVMTDETERNGGFYFGLLLAGVGGVMAQIGTIAVGVQYGLRGAEEDRNSRALRR